MWNPPVTEQKHFLRRHDPHQVTGRSWMTSSQPADTDSPCIFSCKIKTGDARYASCKKSIYKMTSYGGIIRIRLRVEGDSFLSACQHKLPCIYFRLLYSISC